MQALRTACASAQSDQNLHRPPTESVDTTECINGEQRPDDYLRMHRII